MMQAHMFPARFESILTSVKRVREGRSLTVKQFKKLLGLMSAASNVIHFGLLYVRPLQWWLKTMGFIPTSQSMAYQGLSGTAMLQGGLTFIRFLTKICEPLLALLLSCHRCALPHKAVICKSGGIDISPSVFWRSSGSRRGNYGYIRNLERLFLKVFPRFSFMSFSVCSYTHLRLHTNNRLHFRELITLFIHHVE